MKLLFSASDPARVELVKSRLNNANIRCEVRQSGMDASGIPGYAEVWVPDGVDYAYATLIFCERASHQLPF